MDYSEERINANKVSLENFITVDNMLSNKCGITIAANMPPQGSTLPKYNKDNILVGNIRPYLKKIWFANREGGAAADVLIFIVKPEFHPKFVFYAMFRDDFFIHMMHGKKGTKMPRGDKNHILDFLIPDAEYPAQQKIAAVLSALDAKIELNNRINTGLEAMAKTLYNYWFVQFDFPDRNGKPYKSSGGKMVWNKELKRKIPEGWEVKNTAEIATTSSGGTPLSSKEEYYVNGTIPWINSGELNNPFVISTSNYITKAGLQNSSAKIFPVNTILVAIYGATSGKVSLLKIEACTNQAVCGIISKSQIFTNLIRYVFDSLYNHMIMLSSGSARDNLSQDIIKNVKLTLPDELLLEKFNKIVNPVLETVVHNYKENQQLSTFRDWLLPMLMNGQVKVK